MTTTPYLDFVRVIVDGDITEVARRIADTPSLAVASSDVGATRQRSSNFFFAKAAVRALINGAADARQVGGPGSHW